MSSNSGNMRSDPSSASTAVYDDDEDRATARVREMGREDGLFRACMDVIRSSHKSGQALRTAMLAAGLLTDADCYAELLVQFYVVTHALETRMEEFCHARPSSSSSSFSSRGATNLFGGV